MSLKAVHLAFIIVCICFAAGFAVWLVMRYLAEHALLFIVGAGVSLVVAAALIAYAVRFVHKFRRIRYL